MILETVCFSAEQNFFLRGSWVPCSSASEEEGNDQLYIPCTVVKYQYKSDGDFSERESRLCSASLDVVFISLSGIDLA